MTDTFQHVAPIDKFPSHPGKRPRTELHTFALPTQGRAERLHLYQWISEEEGYVAGKFDDQRSGHDDSLKNEGMNDEGFWFRQIVQYLDRARIAFQAAAEFRNLAEQYSRSMTNEEHHSKSRKYVEMARHQEMKAQQALAKAMMTTKGCVESSIRVFGPLPKPGLSSGNVEEWR